MQEIARREPFRIFMFFSSNQSCSLMRFGGEMLERKRPASASTDSETERRNEPTRNRKRRTCRVPHVWPELPDVGFVYVRTAASPRPERSRRLSASRSEARWLLPECPEGTHENSLAFQRRANERKKSRPGRTPERAGYSPAMPPAPDPYTSVDPTPRQRRQRGPPTGVVKSRGNAGQTRMGIAIEAGKIPTPSPRKRNWG